MKNNWYKFLIAGFLGISCFTLFGVIMPNMPEYTQDFIEKLVGYVCLLSFVGAFYISLKTAIIKGMTKTAWATSLVYPIYALMYYMYLAVDYGSKQKHISAIGFSLVTLSLVILQIISLKEKRE